MPENKRNKHNKRNDQIIRVNQAGEFGAVQIYKGQLAVLRNRPCGEVIEHMLEQEHQHLEKFNKLMVERQVRPTILTPLWRAAGYGLGAVSALLGEKAAMACTVAVEEVIDQHYAEQERVLDDKPLKQLITKCRAEENEHKEIGLSYGPAPFPILSMMVKTAARSAIWLSTRI